MATTILNYSTSFQIPTTVTTEQIGPFNLRYGPRPRIGGWFIKDVQSGSYLPLPSFAAVRHYLSELRKKYENTEPTPPSAPHSATIRNQQYMMAQTGIANPLRAHDALMADWIAKHPLTKAA